MKHQNGLMKCQERMKIFTMKAYLVKSCVREKLSRGVFTECRKFIERNGGFGMNELLGIAAAVILAAFIVIPGLRSFSTNIIAALTTWWTDTVKTEIFPPS